MRARDGKLSDCGHRKYSWGEKEGMIKGPRADLEGCPGVQTKRKPGTVHTQQGARVAPGRERDMVDGPEPILDKEGVEAAAVDLLQKFIRKQRETETQMGGAVRSGEPPQYPPLAPSFVEWGPFSNIV